MRWLLSLVALCVLSQPWTAGAAMIIVGSVSATSARVLYDPMSSSPAPSLARASIRSLSDTQQTEYELEKETTLELSASEYGRPQVLHLDGLMPNRQYIVAFQFNAETQEEVVKFRTSFGDSTSASAPANRVLVVSCDRFIEDHDDGMWLEIGDDIQRNEDTFFGVAHIGDQVYVDAGDGRIAIQTVEPAVIADSAALRAHYETIVDQFRAIYRETLGRPAAQQVLRHGAHWMLPDDHEIINNFNSFFVDQAFSDAQGGDAMAAGHRLGIQLHYRAGVQALYEYQVQLREDIAWDDVDFLYDPLEAVISRYPLYFSVDVDALKLFFLDVRFDRSFAVRAEREGLVPDRQLVDLKSTLTSWTDAADPRTAIVVLSGMPLFFHSTLTSTIAYATEKELYPGHSEHLSGLIALYDLFHQTVSGGVLKLLVGGDVHALTHSRVCGYASEQAVQRDRSARCIDQLITSGLTRGSTAINDAKLVPFYFLITRLLPLWNTFARAHGFITSPPWVVNTDRVFLGRNYGVLEMAANGTFEWRNSVVMEHETLGKTVSQFLFDWLDTRVVGAIIAILAIRQTIRVAWGERAQ